MTIRELLDALDGLPDETVAETDVWPDAPRKLTVGELRENYGDDYGDWLARDGYPVGLGLNAPALLRTRRSADDEGRVDAVAAVEAVAGRVMLTTRPATADERRLADETLAAVRTAAEWAEEDHHHGDPPPLVLSPEAEATLDAIPPMDGARPKVVGKTGARTESGRPSRYV